MVFNQGSGETKMDLRETGRKESGGRRGIKQQGVCLCVRQKREGFPLLWSLGLLCWYSGFKKVKVKGKKKSHGWKHVFKHNPQVTSWIVGKDSLSQNVVAFWHLASNYPFLRDIKSDIDNKPMWTVFNGLPSAPDSIISHFKASCECLFVFFYMYVCAPVTKAEYWSKGLCRLWPEPHDKLELIRAGDWGQRIISLFRLAVLPKHQRHAAQYDRIMLTQKPKASLSLLIIISSSSRLLLLMSWLSVTHPTDAGKIKYHVKYSVAFCLLYLNVHTHLEGSWVCVLSIPCQQDYFLWAMM